MPSIWEKAMREVFGGPQRLPVEEFNARPNVIDKAAMRVLSVFSNGLGVGGYFRPLTNKIGYPGNKEYYLDPLSQGAVIRQHEWKHWQQLGSGSKGIVQQLPKMVKAPFIRGRIEKEAGEAERLYDQTVREPYQKAYPNPNYLEARERFLADLPSRDYEEARDRFLTNQPPKGYYQMPWGTGKLGK